MKKVFLIFAIVGIAAPYYFIFKFIEANNWEWSTALFFEQINANPGMRILNADLTVAATTFFVFIIYKRMTNTLTTKRFLTYIASLFLVGFSFAFPMYLYHNYKNQISQCQLLACDLSNVYDEIFTTKHSFFNNNVQQR